MLSFIKKVVKKIIFSFVVLYTVSIIFNFLGIVVPINLFTIFFVASLGFPGVISLVMVYIFLL